MKLPPISDPARYAGLYVYDFGTHVAVGYTAGEIRVLRESERHGGGTAYEIYRVTERGGFELRGTTDARLGLREATCFLHQDGAAALRNYERIRAAAEAHPFPCSVELLLGRFYAFTPSNVTALVYPAAASTTASGWLSRHAPEPGDDVLGGIEVCRTLLASDGIRIASCVLPTGFDLRDRPAEEVLRTVNEPVQR